MPNEVTPQIPTHQKASFIRDGGRYLRQSVVFYLARKNLRYRRLRTVLTVGGVTIGIGAIVFLVSFAFGLRNLVTREVVGSKTVNLIDVTTPKPNTIKLTEEKLSGFARLAHVNTVARSYTFAGKVAINNASADTVVYGTDRNYRDLLSMKYVQGNASSINSGTDVVVNTSFLQFLGVTNSKDLIGKSFELKVEREKPDEEGDKFMTQKFVIKGVVETGSGAEVYTSDTIWTNSGFTQYAQAKVVVDNQKNVETVRKQIEAGGYTTTSPVDTLSQINSVFSVFAFLLAGFGSIGLLVAVLGMFNTLTISLLERTKEIGLMLVLGARQKDIRRVFFTESIILSVAGGLFGLAGALVVGLFCNAVLTTLAKSRGVEGHINVFALPWWMVVVVLIFCGGVGLLVALYPVMRSTKRSPIESLRFE